MTTRAAWKTQIRKRYGVQHVGEARVPKLACSPRLLWTTRCCGGPNRTAGYPEEMYDSCITRYFYHFVVSRGLPFAIVSDKYGLHFSDEVLPHYDVHPTDLSPEDKKTIGAVIRKKTLSKGFEEIVFYNNSPLMSIPYFEMLKHSRLPVRFITRLPES